MQGGGAPGALFRTPRSWSFVDRGGFGWRSWCTGFRKGGRGWWDGGADGGATAADGRIPLRHQGQAVPPQPPWELPCGAPELAGKAIPISTCHGDKAGRIGDQGEQVWVVEEVR